MCIRDRGYSTYLTNKYKCLTPCKNAYVLIDRSVMQKACGDEKTAKWLEENLAIMPDVIPVSYTHLDVYKRQVYHCAENF